jgi:hypothetical protein
MSRVFAAQPQLPTAVGKVFYISGCACSAAVGPRFTFRIEPMRNDRD